MNSSSVLIVVPDETFRHSLAFLMETEGLKARLFDHLPSGDEMDTGMTDIGCALIDHSVMGREPARLEPLLGRDVPVVMLASHLDRMPRLEGVQLVEKPAPGSQVVDAVRGSLAARRRRIADST